MHGDVSEMMYFIPSTQDQFNKFQSVIKTINSEPSVEAHLSSNIIFTITTKCFLNTKCDLKGQYRLPFLDPFNYVMYGYSSKSDALAHTLKLQTYLESDYYIEGIIRIFKIDKNKPIDENLKSFLKERTIQGQQDQEIKYYDMSPLILQIYENIEEYNAIQKYNDTKRFMYKKNSRDEYFLNKFYEDAKTEYEDAQEKGNNEYRFKEDFILGKHTDITPELLERIQVNSNLPIKDPGPRACVIPVSGMTKATLYLWPTKKLVLKAFTTLNSELPGFNLIRDNLVNSEYLTNVYATGSSDTLYQISKIREPDLANLTVVDRKLYKINEVSEDMIKIIFRAPFATSLKNVQINFIFMEYGGPINLSSWYKKEENKVDSPEKAHQLLNIFTGLGLGIKEMHDKDIIHRDIKPANTMIFPPQDGIILKNNVKVTDFSFCVKLKDGIFTEKFSSGTEDFMDPEINKERIFTYSKESDIYAFGVTIKRITDNLFNISDATEPTGEQSPTPEDLSNIKESLESLSENMMKTERKDRPNIQNVLAKLQEIKISIPLKELEI